jgi:hypothetical protein
VNVMQRERWSGMYGYTEVQAEHIDQGHDTKSRKFMGHEALHLIKPRKKSHHITCSLIS